MTLAELLETKLNPPTPRPQAVVRDRLLERLRPAAGVKVVLVAAPAGCGKTTLLGMWRDREATRRPVGWLSVDEGDNDVVVLWSHVLEALRRACPAIDVRVEPAQVGAARVVDTVLPRLVNALADEAGAALVVDDFHRLSSGPARDSVSWFVEHAPSTFQLVVSSRSEPALPLAALRAHGELLELRAGELGFTPGEATTLLNGKLELGLAAEEIDGLVERTEGWPAGLYLAALSLQGLEDPHGFVSRFGGANRHVVDFLVDEVLDAHDAPAQALMVRTSILRRLSGPLCDAVLESEGSGELLEGLSHTNLFLIPLDQRGEWFRFHHLFASLLRVELEHRDPGLAPTLHRRALAWHRDNGSIDEAIGHALQADEFDEAIDLIAATWHGSANRGRHAAVLASIEQFPPSLSRDPQLLVLKAWVCSLGDRRGEAAEAIHALEQIEWPEDKSLPDGSGSLDASLATLRGGFPWDDVGAAHEQALRAAELQTAESPLWPRVCWALGAGSYYQGDLDEADRRFDEAVAVGFREERWLVVASGLAYRSFIAGERLQRVEQRRLAEVASELACEHGIDDSRGEVHVALGAALAPAGDGAAALPLLDRGVAILRASGGPIQVANALIRQATVLQAVDRSRATAAIDEARATVDACADPGVLEERLAALERSQRDPLRRRATRLSDREFAVLRMLGGPLSERDIGRELYLSHNTVHSHTRSIYRKLGASSRNEALQRARELGLV